MTEKKMQLIEAMSRLLKDEERPIFMPIAEYLIELGYLPERRKVSSFSLAFKHKDSKKIMARFDMRQIKRQTPFPLISIKFFGAGDVPPKYTQALVRELDEGHYHGPPYCEAQKNYCGRCNDVCTGGGIGYYHQYPDGRAFLRCGAYPIPIYDLSADDLGEMQQVLLRQHEYFLSIQ